MKNILLSMNVFLQYRCII